jgi:hypothetical protein
MGRRFGADQRRQHRRLYRGCLLVLLIFKLFPASYKVGFIAAALLMMAATLAMWGVNPRLMKNPASGLSLKSNTVCITGWDLIFGARKQVFLTFGPWVLVKVFEQSPRLSLFWG